MKRWQRYGSALACLLVTGCATTGDLETLKMQMNQENSAMETRINAKLEKSVADLEQKIAILDEKMNKILDQMALSRNIQSVQITFNNLKKKIEDSETQIRNYNSRIEDLKSEITKSSSNNQNIQQEISEIEGKMDELISVLEAQGTN
jgi:chromosome segregation ATPase